MNMIAIVDENWAIGWNSQLLFRIKEDMDFFKEMTMNKIVVMGHNTYRSIGHPLKNRTNIVLSRYNHDDTSGVFYHRDFKSVFKAIGPADPDDVFVIGGASIYKELLPYCSKAYITGVCCKARNADTFIENLDHHPNWIQGEVHDCGKADIPDIGIVPYGFITYKNKRIKTMGA